MIYSRRALLAAALAPSRKYRVAVIGHTGRGNYGHGVDTVWRHLPQCEVIACADADAAGLAKAVDRVQPKRSYSDYREMLRVEKPDIVGIGPRHTDQRIPMVTAAAEARAHIFMEKPFASSPDEADVLVDAVRKAGIKLQIAHQMRLSPFALRAKAMIEAGEIGAVEEIRCRGKEDRRAGGEDLMVLGSHLCDMMRFFLGNPRWVAAHVTQDGDELSASHVRKATEPIGPVAGNQIAAMFAFGNGVHAYMATRAAAETDPLRYGTWIYGTKGALFIPFGIYPDGSLNILRSPAWLPNERAKWERVNVAQPLDTGSDTANVLMVTDLLNAIENNAKPVCNEDDGRWTIDMIHGIYRAQRSGGRVPFPLADRTHALNF